MVLELDPGLTYTKPIVLVAHQLFVYVIYGKRQANFSYDGAE